MFEHKEARLLSKKQFANRLLRSVLVSIGIVAFSLLLGTVGYHFFAGLDWLDSFYNSSMILTGMGPVNKLETDGAKLFASFYALYSGLAFLGTIAVVVTPIAHRIMHKFHVEEDEK